MDHKLANKLQFTDKELWWPFADKNVEYPIKKNAVVKSVLVLVPGPSDNTAVADFDSEFLKSCAISPTNLYFTQ